MGWFTKKARAVALIDIGSSSVGGAYAHIEDGKPPVIFYTARIPIDTREGDLIATDMLRSLERLVQKLVREGAPVMHEATGSGEIVSVLATISAPWQETSVRVESIRDEKSFVFTRALLERATKTNDLLPEGRIEVEETVIATILNGYETTRPFGRRIKRADLVILSATLDAEVARAVERTISHTYHTHALQLVAFAPLAYEILRDLYPLQRDFLVLNVEGAATDLSLVKGGFLVDVRQVNTGVHDLVRAAQRGGMRHGSPSSAIDIHRPADSTRARITTLEGEWVESIKSGLADFASRHPLPRTLFLITAEDARDFLKKLLDTDTLRSLWLSEDPLTIIPVLPEQLAGLVKTRGSAQGDVYVSMLALYFARRIAGFPMSAHPH